MIKLFQCLSRFRCWWITWIWISHRKWKSSSCVKICLSLIYLIFFCFHHPSWKWLLTQLQIIAFLTIQLIFRKLWVKQKKWISFTKLCKQSILHHFSISESTYGISIKNLTLLSEAMWTLKLIFKLFRCRTQLPRIMQIWFGIFC